MYWELQWCSLAFRGLAVGWSSRIVVTIAPVEERGTGVLAVDWVVELPWCKHPCGACLLANELEIAILDKLTAALAGVWWGGWGDETGAPGRYS